jgi:hypothetical protein
MDRAVLQGAEQKEIRQIPRRDQPPVSQAKAPRRRPAGGAIDRGQGRAQGDGAAHQVVQVALFVDSQRIAIVGGEAKEGRGELVDQRNQGSQIFRSRAGTVATNLIETS